MMNKDEEIMRCNKLVEDGKAVCGVTLDCHLHDWRQEDMKEQWQKEAREDNDKKWVERIEKLPHGTNGQGEKWVMLDDIKSLLSDLKEKDE